MVVSNSFEVGCGSFRMWRSQGHGARFLNAQTAASVVEVARRGGHERSRLAGGCATARRGVPPSTAPHFAVRCPVVAGQVLSCA